MKMLTLTLNGWEVVYWYYRGEKASPYSVESGAKGNLWFQYEDNRASGYYATSCGRKILKDELSRFLGFTHEEILREITLQLPS